MMRQKLKDPQPGLRHRLHRLHPPGAPRAQGAQRAHPHQRRRPQPAGLPRRGSSRWPASSGVSGLRVGVVEGDDILPRLRELIDAGHRAEQHGHRRAAGAHRRPGDERQRLPGRPAGRARPCGQGAHIVLCGRVTDTALALAPMIHEFGWAEDDWDRLAAGTIAGHIIECGAQCTGGNFSRWWEVPDLWNVGYPIVEARGGRHLHGHQARGDRRHGDGRYGLRAARLRDGRSRGLHHAGRDRRLHLHPRCARTARTGCASRASRAAEDAVPQGLGLLPRRLQGERPDHALRPAGGGEGAGWRPRSSGSGWSGRASPSRDEDRETSSCSARAPACPGSSTAPDDRPRSCCASACGDAGSRPRWSASARRSRRSSPPARRA